MDRDQMAAMARDGWGKVASAYVDQLFNELENKPFDRERLETFAAGVQPGTTVVDIGCGPGHVGLFLRQLGVDVLGIDLSPEMIAEARKLAPQARFEVGNVLELAAGDETFAGALAMYSLINLLREDLPVALAEIFRVLIPGSAFLMAVHRGSEEIVAEEIFDKPVHMVATLFEAEEVRAAAESAGFVIDHLEMRGPYETEYQSERVYLRAHRP